MSQENPGNAPWRRAACRLDDDLEGALVDSAVRARPGGRSRTWSASRLSPPRITWVIAILGLPEGAGQAPVEDREPAGRRDEQVARVRVGVEPRRPDGGPVGPAIKASTISSASRRRSLGCEAPAR